LQSPRYILLAFDETDLPPLQAPRSGSGDFAACGRLVELMEWVIQDVRRNYGTAYPEILIRSLGFLTEPRSSVRNQWKRGSHFPRYVYFDTRDPIKIFGQAVEDLLRVAEAATATGGLLDEEVLRNLHCRIDAAMTLKGDAGIDVRFDVLEMFLELLGELKEFHRLIDYATL
jgi:hypothetical protein